jgi:hypothetical protein
MHDRVAGESRIGVGEFLQTFLQFPPRQKAASFTIDQVQAKIEAAFTGRD